MIVDNRWLLLVLLAAAAPAPAPATQETVLIERSLYIAPSWADATEGTDTETRYATHDEYVAAAGDDRYLLEKLRYRSDGLVVVAYLYRPRDEGKHPVVVFNRGSYVRGDIAPELLPMFHRLALAGFAVVAPMYRGSDGGEGRDELGGADLADLINVTKLIAELPRRSAIAWPEKLNLPLLLMHGSDDQTVSPTQTLLLAIELAKAGKEFGVIVFPGGNHVLTEHRRERDRKAVEHFRRYMAQ